MMSKAKTSRSHPAYLLLGAVLSVSTLVSGNVCAQAAVIDVPHTIKTTFGWIVQYEQMISDYQQQLNQYETLMKQYKQSQVGGDTYQGNPGYRETFKERDINEGADKRCGQKSGKNPASSEQHDLCISIVQLENGRYNAMIKSLEDVKVRDQQLRAAVAERGELGDDDVGKLQSNSNRMLAIQTQLQNDKQNAQTLTKAYDAAIKNLKEKQVLAANRTLDGESSLLGDATQGIALKLALKAARMRDR